MGLGIDRYTARKLQKLSEVAIYTLGQSVTGMSNCDHHLTSVNPFQIHVCSNNSSILHEALLHHNIILLLCVCVCVCMCVCVCVCSVCVCVCVCLCVSMCVQHVCVCPCMWLHMCVCPCICVHMCVCALGACICGCMCIHFCKLLTIIIIEFDHTSKVRSPMVPTQGKEETK